MDVDLGQIGQPLANGEDFSADTDDIHIGYGVAEDLEDVICAHQNSVIICDSNTRAATEPFLEEELKDCLVIELSPEGLAVDEACIARVISQLEVCDRGQSSVEVDLLVAIGNRTIHDLTRFGAAEFNTPFVSIPIPAEDAETAGVSVPDIAPRWVFADTRILCEESDGRTEKEEKIIHVLSACGINTESIHKILQDCDDL